MLFWAIGLCSALLVAANLAASRSPMPRLVIGLLCFVAFLGHPFAAGMMLPAVMYCSLFLLIATLGCGAIAPRSLSTFRTSSIVAALFALGLSGYSAWRTESGYAQLRAQYPMEPLENRLPARPRSDRKTPLSAAALGRLARFEEPDEIEDNFRDSGRRGRRLGRLHEDAVQSFIASFGAGVYRISPYPTALNLAIQDHDVSDRRQPGHRVAEAGSPGDWTLLQARQDDWLVFLLDRTVSDFANPRSFGYFRDLRHVAGFIPHQVREVPDTTDAWRVQTLDLVGLLLHDGPIVYVSADLPKMDELRHVPVRPLDRFEVVGLESLRDGEDLMIVRDGETTRMLGAIRSTKQCLSCHGGGRGDLLGAFTYTFRQVEPVSSTKTAALR